MRRMSLLWQDGGFVMDETTKSNEEMNEERRWIKPKIHTTSCDPVYYIHMIC